MNQHVDKLDELVTKLEMAGKEIGEREQVDILLNSLSEPYAQVVIGIENWNEDKITLAEVTSRLLHEEEKHEQANKKDEAAFQAGGKGKRRRDKSQVTCYGCNKKGHYKSECPEKEKGEDTAARADEYVFAAQTEQRNKKRFLLDSGASRHMVNDVGMLTGTKYLKEHATVHLADNSEVPGIAVGKLKVILQGVAVVITNVLLVPELERNLISIEGLTGMGAEVKFADGSCKINRSGKTVLTVKSNRGLYEFDAEVEKGETAALVETTQEKEWHKRLGHVPYVTLDKMAKEGIVEGLPKNWNPGTIDNCISCIKGKLARKKFPTSEQNRNDGKVVLHTDMMGPMRVMTPEKKKYVITFLIEESRYAEIALCSRKSEAAKKTIEFITKYKVQTGKTIQIIRSDNAKEYVEGDLKKYCEKQGIIQETTVPHTPQQNGMAERLNRTLMEMAKCMLFESGMSDTWWGEAIITATYVRNRIHSNTIKSTPYETEFGVKADVGYMRQFGEDCFAFVPEGTRTKLKPKAIECRFLGYGDRVKGYRLVRKDNKKIIHSRDVKWLTVEKMPMSIEITETDEQEQAVGELEPQHDKLERNKDTSKVKEELKELRVRFHDELTPATTNPETITPRRSGRVTRPVMKYGTYANAAIMVFAAVPGDEPTSYQESQEGKESKEWKLAMESEMKSLEENGTYEACNLPNGKKAIGCKWVYKIKKGADGEIIKYKARIVAQGYNQREGVDYFETFSPVVNIKTVRMILALATNLDLEVHQIDFTTAYLNGDITEEIYMKQPAGFDDGTGRVLKLKKALYGLKQSGRQWNKKLHEYLTSQDYVQSGYDPCLYLKWVSNGGMVWLCVYVDDTIIAGHQESTVVSEKENIRKHFKSTDQGSISFVLGMKIERYRESRKMKLSQEVYIDKMLDQFGMKESKPASTPMATDFRSRVQKIPKQENAKENEDDEKFEAPYRQLIGSLLHLSNYSRPDISLAVSILSRSLDSYTENHWMAAKRVLRYLNGTKSHCLIYGRDVNDGIKLNGYADADWAGDETDRKSMSGWTTSIGKNVVNWNASKQGCVTLSTAEAEYVAAGGATQEIVWARGLMKELGIDQGTVTLLEDNQSCIAMSLNPVKQTRTKHVDIKDHFIREEVKRGTLKLEYCPTKENMADILTKPLNKETHEYLKGKLGIMDFGFRGSVGMLNPRHEKEKANLPRMGDAQSNLR
jgi:hypothetical protein